VAIFLEDFFSFLHHGFQLGFEPCFFLLELSDLIFDFRQFCKPGFVFLVQGLFFIFIFFNEVDWVIFWGRRRRSGFIGCDSAENNISNLFDYLLWILIKIR
jgi:hypothetical protein